MGHGILSDLPDVKPPEKIILRKRSLGLRKLLVTYYATKLTPMLVGQASCAVQKAPEGRYVYSTSVNQFSQAPEGRHVYRKFGYF